MKVRIDRKTYPNVRRAVSEMQHALLFCDGSERERMAFALSAVLEGFTDIDTYRERCGFFERE